MESAATFLVMTNREWLERSLAAQGLSLPITEPETVARVVAALRTASTQRVWSEGVPALRTSTASGAIPPSRR